MKKILAATAIGMNTIKKLVSGLAMAFAMLGGTSGSRSSSSVPMLILVSCLAHAGDGRRRSSSGASFARDGNHELSTAFGNDTRCDEEIDYRGLAALAIGLIRSASRFG